MNKKEKIISMLVLCFMFPSVTYANVVWPALYTETKVSSVSIILLSLVIEFFFFKWLFKLDIKKAIYYAILANIASGVFGLVLRPLSGIAYEFSLGLIVNSLFNWGTFNPVAWFFVPIFGGATNAFLELLTIRLIWKHKINKKNYFLIWIINAITVAVATIWVVLYPPSM
jgi:hypothetical protein